MERIDHIEDRIKASEKLSPKNKAMLLRLCKIIRTIIAAIRHFLASIANLLRQHRAFVETIIAVTICSMLISLVPICGQFLSALVMSLGLLLAVVRDCKENFGSLIDLFVNEKGITL